MEGWRNAVTRPEERGIERLMDLLTSIQFQGSHLKPNDLKGLLDELANEEANPTSSAYNEASSIPFHCFFIALLIGFVKALSEMDEVEKAEGKARQEQNTVTKKDKGKGKPGGGAAKSKDGNARRSEILAHIWDYGRILWTVVSSRMFDDHLQSLQGLLAAVVPGQMSLYADELFRAQKRNGSYSFTTKGVPGYLLSPLGDLIRQKLSNAGHAWGNSMRFLLQVRGIKHTTQHQLDEDAAELAIHYPPWNDIDADADDLWFADIGVEITSERGDCLQWRTDRHAQVVKHALQISEANATRITSLGSGEYERDVVAHLLQVSECRIKTGSRSQGFYRARYVQLYTTDKALTYSPEGGHYGKFMQVSDALTKNQPPTFTTKLRQLYIHAMDRNASHCRIELRVPLARGTKVLLNFPRHLLE